MYSLRIPSSCAAWDTSWIKARTSLSSASSCYSSTVPSITDLLIKSSQIASIANVGSSMY